MGKLHNIYKYKHGAKVLALLFMLCFGKSWGQNIFSQGFAGGTVAPAGWSFTAIGGTYTSAGNFGNSSPSLQFDNTNDRVVTESFVCGDQLSFWVKGQGTNATSALLVEGFNGTIWTTIVNLTPLPTTGTVYSYAISTTIIQIRFTYTKSVGNLALDDVTVRQGNCATNTITTDLVNNPPFALTDCTVTASGTVTFSSTGTFNVGNNYTAQLSDASGSFASSVAIGSISSTANTGVVSFTIPAGTPSGTGYMIRVVSDNPVITGSNSSVFTITTTCTPTITPGGTITACAFSGAMSIFDKCNNGQGCTTGCDLSTYSNLGYTMCDGSANNSNCFGAANPGGQQLQGIVFNIPSGCTMSVTVEFKTRGGACSNSGMDNGDYLKINGTTYTGTGNADITQSISQTGGSIFIEQSANRSDEILTFTASIVSGSCLQCSLLDVTLLNFNCISESDGYKLVWATANEHQSKNFEIEYSVDGVEFHKIAEMPAKGESNSYLYYENYIQNVFSSPLLYFRLKMNDLNGGYTYSPIIYVQNDFFSSLSVSPNPSVNTDVIVYVGTKLNYLNSTISIYDVNGKLLVDEIIKDSQTKINTHDFAEGIYLLKVSSPYKTQSFKLIIQK